MGVRLTLTVFLILIIAALTAWIGRLWNRRTGDGHPTEAMLESFAEQLEEENDRLIEMMAALRRHVDERLAAVPDPSAGRVEDPRAETILRTVDRLGSIERELLRLHLRIERLEQAPPPRRAHRQGTVEVKLSGAKASGADILPFDPSDLKAPFREATRRIAAGEEARKVGRDLGLVSGEVEILERLVRAAVSERESRG
jgi:hypothetical protein